MMPDEQLMQAVSSVGFPIAVASYLLVRVQKSMDNFASKMDQLLMEIRQERISSTMPPRRAA